MPVRFQPNLKVEKKNPPKGLKKVSFMNKIFIIFLILLVTSLVSKAETGCNMYLRYQPIQNKILKTEYSEYCKIIAVVGDNEILSSVKTELKTGIKKMLGVKPVFNKLKIIFRNGKI